MWPSMTLEVFKIWFKICALQMLAFIYIFFCQNQFINECAKKNLYKILQGVFLWDVEELMFLIKINLSMTGLDMLNL